MQGFLCIKIFFDFFHFSLAIFDKLYYNNTCKARERPFTKGSEAMEEGMTNAEFDAFLETLAPLIEAKAATVKEAADLVRDKKSK